MAKEKAYKKKNEGMALIGRKAICDYAGRSWEMIELWMAEMAFPAAKIGGVWESDQRLVDEWKREQIVGKS